MNDKKNKKQSSVKKNTLKAKNKSSEKEASIQSKILEVARRTVLSKGYDALSIRTLMEKLEYSPMVFYRYFKNKRALLHFLWEDIFAALIQSMEKNLDITKQTSESKIKKIASGNIEFWIKHPDKYKIVYLNPDFLEDNNEDLFFVQSPLIKDYLDRILTVISFEKKEKKIAKDLSDMDILRSMVILVQGVAHSLITVPEFQWGSDRRMYQMMVGIWYKGIS